MHVELIARLGRYSWDLINTWGFQADTGPVAVVICHGIPPPYYIRMADAAINNQ